MRIVARVSVLLICVIVYALVYMTLIRHQEDSSDKLQRPEDLEVLKRLERIEDQVNKIGEFVAVFGWVFYYALCIYENVTFLYYTFQNVCI